MTLQEVQQLLNAALECSVFFAPREPGLTYQELTEFGQRFGLQQGEIGDAMRHHIRHDGRSYRLLPPDNTTTLWSFFSLSEDPDLRDIPSFDFVLSEMNERIRADGGERARLDRDVIVERAVSSGLLRDNVEAAFTVLLMTGQFGLKDGLITSPHKRQYTPLPSEQHSHPARPVPMRREARGRAAPIVKDILARRADGRPSHAEPLDAFGVALKGLGYEPFRLWWSQTVAELRKSDPSSSPVTVAVLAAALVEGSLTFVVRHARALDLGLFRSSDYDRDPRTWKIDDLVASAAHGGSEAILDATTKARADSLIRVRQRIHAGRMLSQFPGGVPDLRPEEARDAKATAETVLRSVLDWLNRHPATGG